MAARRFSESLAVEPIDVDGTLIEKQLKEETTTVSAAVDDAENNLDPKEWSRARKWSIVIILSMMSLAGNTATIMCAPAAPEILKSLGSTNHVYSTLLVTMFDLGEAFGPIILGPASEMYGRRIAYNGANIVLVVFIVLAAVSVNLPMLIMMRFFCGVGCAMGVLNPSVIGDLFKQEERGRGMAAVNLPPLLGPVAGPIIGGYVTQYLGWRWVFGINAIFAGICALIFLVFFPETYHDVIKRKAANVRRVDDCLEIQREQTDHSTKPFDIRKSFIRPLQLLIFCPIVTILTLYIALSYAYGFIVFTTLPWVFENRYGFSKGPVGLTFLGIAIGIVCAVLFCGVTLDRVVQARKRAGREMLPEHRLPPLIVGTVLLVGGFLLYGWAAETHRPWIAPIIGTGLIGFGMITLTISMVTYIVDAFPSHAASAMAAVGIVRSFAAAAFPLVAVPLYDGLGLGWGNTLLAFVAAVGIPITVVLMRYGKRIRAGSKYSSTS